jgi:hypothetical protein
MYFYLEQCPERHCQMYFVHYTNIWSYPRWTVIWNLSLFNLPLLIIKKTITKLNWHNLLLVKFGQIIYELPFNSRSIVLKTESLWKKIINAETAMAFT